MNTFYKNIQPNIIKFSDDESIPEKLRCHYVINYNVWGIDYFFENYLLQESTEGAFLILNENDFNFILENSLSNQNAIDLPRIYIVITDDFLNDDSKFREFILKAAKNNEVYANGIDGFKPGIDYYLNQTLFNYLVNIDSITSDENSELVPTDYQLPNYLDENGHITKYFIDLTGDLITDYTNLNYFNKKNNLLNGTYSEETLNNFYQNLCKLILTNTTIQNNSEIFNKLNNQIYYKVLNYYANSQIDDASISLNLILNSNYGTITSYNTNCNCNTNTSGNITLTDSCSSIYTQAMSLYLQKMFGDKDFYEDWFFVYLSETEKLPNDVLIEAIQLFINEFINIDYNLDFSSYGISYQCDCKNQISLNNSTIEYKKIFNFLTILNYVNNNQLLENTNKIKIYGEQFGELLPKLQF